MAIQVLELAWFHTLGKYVGTAVGALLKFEIIQNSDRFATPGGPFGDSGLEGLLIQGLKVCCFRCCFCCLSCCFSPPGGPTTEPKTAPQITKKRCTNEPTMAPKMINMSSRRPPVIPWAPGGYQDAIEIGPGALLEASGSEKKFAGSGRGGLQKSSWTIFQRLEPLPG